MIWLLSIFPVSLPIHLTLVSNAIGIYLWYIMVHVPFRSTKTFAPKTSFYFLPHIIADPTFCYVFLVNSYNTSIPTLVLPSSSLLWPNILQLFTPSSVDCCITGKQSLLLPISCLFPWSFYFHTIIFEGRKYHIYLCKCSDWYIGDGYYTLKWTLVTGYISFSNVFSKRRILVFPASFHIILELQFAKLVPF